jgi:hypothetical protein
MEACSAARIVKCLFQAEDSKCCIALLVTDDDASVRKILTHSFKDRLDTGTGMIAEQEDWARCTQMGKKTQITDF